ncbi:MAG: hypothetical protein Q4B96_04655 [Bacillota bacterium]|nr:hypothetical protein [Bacillota bacterium]
MMKEKINKFFEDRYGYDSLGRTLFILAILCIAASFFTQNDKAQQALFIAALFFVFFEVMRLISRNINQRRNEFELYNGLTAAVRYRLYVISNKKENMLLSYEQFKNQSAPSDRVILCPRCKNEIPVPVRAGKHTLKCRKCGKLVQTKN